MLGSSSPLGPLTFGPRLTGSCQGLSNVSRLATHISLRPYPPGRPLEKYNSSPSCEKSHSCISVASLITGPRLVGSLMMIVAFAAAASPTRTPTATPSHTIVILQLPCRFMVLPFQKRFPLSPTNKLNENSRSCAESLPFCIFFEESRVRSYTESNCGRNPTHRGSGCRQPRIRRDPSDSRRRLEWRETP
jgi:hypothetical protein